MMSDNRTNRNKQECVHPHKENTCAIRKRSPSALGGTVGTRMNTVAMVSSALPHGPGGIVPITRLPVSPELLAVTSRVPGRAASPCELRHHCSLSSAAAGPSVGSHPHRLPCHPLGPGSPPGIFTGLELEWSQPSATLDWDVTQDLSLRCQGDHESERTLPWGP